MNSPYPCSVAPLLRRDLVGPSLRSRAPAILRASHSRANDSALRLLID